MPLVVVYCLPNDRILVFHRRMVVSAVASAHYPGIASCLLYILLLFTRETISPIYATCFFIISPSGIIAHALSIYSKI